MVNETAFGLLVIVFVIAAVTDLRTGKIFNWLTYPAIVLGIAFWTCTGLYQHGLPGAIAGGRESTLAMLTGLVPFVILVLLGGLGGGDAKLMGAVGSLSARWECVLDTAVYALLIAVVLAVLIMIRKRVVVQTLRRIFGAALTVAARVKPEFPVDSPRVPFGVAIGLGGIVAAADHLLGLHLPWHAW